MRQVEKMIAEGRMTPSGMAIVEEAHQNGERDAAIRSGDTSNVPPDVQEAVAADEIVQR